MLKDRQKWNVIFTNWVPGIVPSLGLLVQWPLCVYIQLLSNSAIELYVLVLIRKKVLLVEMFILKFYLMEDTVFVFSCCN